MKKPQFTLSSLVVATLLVVVVINTIRQGHAVRDFHQRLINYQVSTTQFMEASRHSDKLFIERTSADLDTVNARIGRIEGLAGSGPKRLDLRIGLHKRLAEVEQRLDLIEAKLEEKAQ